MRGNFTNQGFDLQDFLEENAKLIIALTAMACLVVAVLANFLGARDALCKTSIFAKSCEALKIQSPSARIQARAWKAALNNNDCQAFRGYLQSYPNGENAILAQSILNNAKTHEEVKGTRQEAKYPFSPPQNPLSYKSQEEAQSRTMRITREYAQTNICARHNSSNSQLLNVEINPGSWQCSNNNGFICNLANAEANCIFEEQKSQIVEEYSAF